MHRKIFNIFSSSTYTCMYLHVLHICVMVMAKNDDRYTGYLQLYLKTWTEYYLIVPHGFDWTSVWRDEYKASSCYT
jgi:hypothetical protein